MRERPGKLPEQLSSFVGRRREIAEVSHLVRTSRAVTLTGVGGVGKTRLALRVAAGLRRTFDDGVWFVDLAEVCGSGVPVPASRTLTPRAATATSTELEPDVPGVDALAFLVMSVLDTRPDGTGSPVQQLAGHLAGRRALLLLDNCEHVIPECARLVSELLAACDAVQVLATSREPLAVGGETRYAVPPLPLPGAGPPDGDAARCESVALFVERARAAVPSFGLTAENRDAVARLCDRVDGLPLAIELAAARVRVLSPEQILARLTDRFTLLSSGARDSPVRQQTLRACMAWSFDLCSRPEQLLWARLSTFVGGFEPDAVEEVCADDELPADGLAALLAGLVGKSVVHRVDPGDGSDHASQQTRYRMLETLRGFGRERLGDAGQEPVLRLRHRDWCRGLVDRAGAQWISEAQVYWFARLTREHANLRAAVELCLRAPAGTEADVETALHLVVTLPRVLWANQGVAREGLSWLDQALAAGTAGTIGTVGTAPTALRAQALALAGGLALRSGDPGTGDRRLEEARHLAEALDDPLALASCAYVDAATAWGRNDLRGAIESAERGLATLARLAEPELPLRLHLLIHAQWAAAMAGDEERSRRYSGELLRIAERRGELANRSMTEWGIALAAWRAGDVDEAARHVRESARIRLTARMPYVHHAGLNVELMAWIAGHGQRHRRAATLLGAADSLLVEHGTPIATTYRMLLGDHLACERRARDALGDEAFAAAFHQGQALTLDEALAYAVEAPPAARAAPAAEHAPTPTPLTRREQEIAELVAHGLSNKDIARTLVISRRTAEAHVQRILTKLGFANRAQIAAWIAGRDLAVRPRGPWREGPAEVHLP